MRSNLSVALEDQQDTGLTRFLAYEMLSFMMFTQLQLVPIHLVLWQINVLSLIRSLFAQALAYLAEIVLVHVVTVQLVHVIE